MKHESTTWMESGLLEKIRQSNTLEKTGATSVEIKPRDIGKDTQGWSVGESEIPVQTLEEAIVVAMEIQARE